MSGGGEVRVLRQEAGQESPRMPAWKREILERRKAKGGGAGGGAGAAAAATAAAAEACQGGGAQRVNGEVTGNGSGPPKDNGTSRNYTISTASQHFAGKRGNNLSSPELSPVKTNKDPWTTAAAPTDPHDSTERDGEGHESLVLHDSLGPLQENPFIKLEKERKRRQDRENAARPVQHILELYGSVPGIRTIRAENIIIIESDPDYFPEAGSKSQQNGVSSYSSLNDLLEQRGSAVTEIRAKEVVIYDTTLSKSEENLSTLGRPDLQDSSYDTDEGQGRVSRMLQKFDSNYGKLQKKSHSTENLLDLESSSSRPRLPRPKPQPDLVPKHVLHPQPGSPGHSPGRTPPSPVFQSPQSSKPKPQPDVSETESPPPQSASSFRQPWGRGVGVAVSHAETDRPQPKPTRERDRDITEVPPKTKVPCSPESPCARAESSASPISSKAPRSSSSEFQIRPSPKPDLSLIPAGDAQARALANLRLQSRNSFTVIPKRHLPASAASTPGSPAPSAHVKSPPSRTVAEAPTPGVPTSHAPTPAPAPSKRKEEKVSGKEEVGRAARSSKPAPPSPVTTTPTPPPTPAPSSPFRTLTPVHSTPSPPRSPSPSPAPFPSPSPAFHFTPKQHVDQLPVTNIDDFDVEPPQPLLAPAHSPAVQRRKGNTFTVVPKRKPEVQAQAGSPEPQQDAAGEAQPGTPTPSQAPYAQLGSLLKKRYPAVEDIEVIGGYLSLGKSCLSQTGSTGKKLKISFNESSLQSTYEYPSESSVWDSGDEDEEENERQEGKVADDQPSMVGRIHIPRPSFTSSPTHTANSTDLSNYIPKHSVDFNAWQEHKLDDPVYQADPSSQHTQMSEEVMLTPADSSSLSDFSSEPALYF
ncbi:taperin [Diretmus argenteus]